MKQAFLLLSNKCSSPITTLYQQLKQATKALGDLFLLYHQTTAVLPEALNGINTSCFSDNLLTDLHYIPISHKLIPGNNHFPLLDFYRKNPVYDFYWFIEDDVRFNGPWQDLFNYFTLQPEPPDFISSHLRTFKEEPSWYWWDTLFHFNTRIPHNLRIRSFNPLYRISYAALSCIDFILSVDKWRGHHEVLLPTILSLEGYQIADFGGTGQFVPQGQQNKFYLDDDPDQSGSINTGTMRYRPFINRLEYAGKLYHPVKD
ncbi:hypothetical protein [Longitalea arenae]|uniref:hypothetical protein n=1 Tax=Longitalea arenae TaxID=2812558 RepID=UPI0019674A96|nr:hypothetical protein [Longitalea arenae]